MPFPRLIDLIFPKTCYSCNAFSNEPLCAACLSKIKYAGPVVCDKCGLPGVPAADCPSCRRRNRELYFEKARGACFYEGPVKKMILGLKYGGRDYLAGPLGKIMADEIRRWDFFRTCGLLVPVPLHWHKRLIRGFNQAELLARRVSLETGIPMETRELKKKRATAPQAGLERSKRLENVKNAFYVRKSAAFAGKKIIIIDDVSTTCETLNQCALALKRSGASDVYGFTLARDA
jgi:ComF family protein